MSGGATARGPVTGLAGDSEDLSCTAGNAEQSRARETAAKASGVIVVLAEPGPQDAHAKIAPTPSAERWSLQRSQRQLLLAFL